MMKNSKKCPICKIELSLDDFSSYFCNVRQKRRYQSYCKCCHKKQANERGKKHYKLHSCEKKEYQKEYRLKNKEIIKENRKKYKSMYVKSLKTCYVRELLTKKNKFTKEVLDENPIIIEIKKNQIKIKRKWQEINSQI